MVGDRLRIGIPVIGGAHWRAGVQYVHLLARAVHTLPPERRPDLHLVLRPESLLATELHLPFLDLFQGVIMLLDGKTDARLFRGHAFVICADERELFERIDFFFPVLDEVGLSGCAACWIADFRHRHQPELYSPEQIERRDRVCAQVAERARLVVVGDESMREDFVRFYPESAARTRVLALPLEPWPPGAETTPPPLPEPDADELVVLGEALSALAREAVALFALLARRRHATLMDTDRAEQAWQQGRAQEALEILHDVLEADPEDSRAAFALGSILSGLDQRDLAIRFLERSIRAVPSVPAVLKLGDLLAAGGSLTDAAQVYYRFLDLEPDNDRVIAASVQAEERWADQLVSRSLVRDLNYRRKPYRVSALVSTYASADFIAECLEDLEAQTIAEDLEIVVVDAASPQDEGGIVERFQQRHSNIRYLRTPERIGIYPAWNLAARVACGEFLTSASTNDRLNPQAYGAMSAALQERPEVALVYGDSYLTELPHQRFGGHTPSRFRDGAYRWPAFRFEDLLANSLVGPHPMWRRSAHQIAGYFDGRYQAIGDQDFWNRLSWKRALLHLPLYTGLAWITRDSLSGRPGVMSETREIKAKHRRYYEKLGGRRAV
jgi:tetratricopeptide (TPR) repeat protein